MRFSKTLLVFALLLISVGCQTLAKRNNTGVIVARRAQIRSSTAVVAADLLQVNRGDVVEILDSTDVTDPSDNLRKERWLRVKARDTDLTEGWIEARNVMPEDVLEDSKKLADATPHGRFVELPGRHHFNAPGSRVFREAAIEFFSGNG